MGVARTNRALVQSPIYLRLVMGFARASWALVQTPSVNVSPADPLARNRPFAERTAGDGVGPNESRSGALPLPESSGIYWGMPERIALWCIPPQPSQRRLFIPDDCRLQTVTSPGDPRGPKRRSCCCLRSKHCRPPIPPVPEAKNEASTSDSTARTSPGTAALPQGSSYSRKARALDFQQPSPL